MRIEIRGPLGCHVWLGATTRRGYPVMKIKGRTRLARRVIYEREKRLLQPGEEVVMQCGERLCVWSAHMHAKPRSSRARPALPAADEAAVAASSRRPPQ